MAYVLTPVLDSTFVSIATGLVANLKALGFRVLGVSGLEAGAYMGRATSQAFGSPCLQEHG